MYPDLEQHRPFRKDGMWSFVIGLSSEWLQLQKIQLQDLYRIYILKKYSRYINLLDFSHQKAILQLVELRGQGF